MSRVLAVVVLLSVLGCGSESDTSQPGGGAHYPAGYILSECSYTCYTGSGGGKSSNSSCASGSAHLQYCGGSKEQCYGSNPCLHCYNERWVCN